MTQGFKRGTSSRDSRDWRTKISRDVIGIAVQSWLSAKWTDGLIDQSVSGSEWNSVVAGLSPTQGNFLFLKILLRWIPHIILSHRSKMSEMSKFLPNHCGDNQESTLFSWLDIYYAHLASVGFGHSVCHGSLTTTCIMLLA